VNLTLLGAILGGLVGTGLLLAVLATPPMRRQTMSDRIAPYVLDAARPSRLLTGSANGGTVTALGRLTAPLVRDAVKFIDKVLGGQVSVERRLAALDSPLTVDQFRVEQVVWGACGAAAGAALGFLAVLLGQSNPLILILLIVACAAGGVLGRDWWLSQAVSKREADIIAEFPVIAEMLALAVTAGESPTGAIDRITRLAHGPLVTQLGGVLAETRAGASFLTSLTRLRDRTGIEPLARFLDGMAVAIERGTPLADVLRAQAADVRALGKRQLLESGGRKEIAMMVPVVFLVLPITILFALYPGLLAIASVAQ
jgi:tight adherence protein C